MRQIDAENLEKRMTKGNPYFDEAVETEICHYIHTEHTVDAIPISYIKNKSKEIRKLGEKRMFTSLIIEANTLDDLIESWRKNDNRRTEKSI